MHGMASDDWDNLFFFFDKKLHHYAFFRVITVGGSFRNFFVLQERLSGFSLFWVLLDLCHFEILIHSEFFLGPSMTHIPLIDI